MSASANPFNIESKETSREIETTGSIMPKLSAQHRNALCSHASYFKDQKGEFTAESLKDALCKLGIIEPLAYLIADATLSRAYLNACPYATLLGGGKFTREELVKLVHPYDTGIFNKDGSFNEELFNKLETYARTDETGRKVISQDEIEEFQKKESQHDERWKNTNLSLKDSLVARVGAKGEFLLLFNILADAKIDGVPHISLTRLKRFYIDGYSLFAEVAAERRKEKQLSKPSRCSTLFQTAKPIVVGAAFIGSYALVGLQLPAVAASIFLLSGAVEKLQHTCKRSHSK